MDIQTAYQHLLTAALDHHPKDEAERIARILLEDIYGITNKDKIGILPTSHLSIPTIVSRINANEPVQYITGISYFYDLKLEVNPDVLIPRPETEELVDHILSKHKEAQLSLLDIGTGSGCIPVTIQSKRPKWNVYASDISQGALGLAKKNASQLNSLVQFILNDILDESLWENLPKVDIIVSNPPYIPYSEKDKMPKHVLGWEPELALFSEEQPLLFYEKIARFGTEYLNDGGWLYFELNEYHAEAIKSCVEGFGYTDVDIIQDMSGKNRMLEARWLNG